MQSAHFAAGAFVLLVSVELVSAWNAVDTNYAKQEIATSTLLASGVVLWPCIWVVALKKCMVSCSQPYLVASILWPPLIIMLHAYCMRYSTLSKRIFRTSQILFESQAVISIAYMFSNFLQAQKNSHCANLFIYASVLCFVFVNWLPAPPDTTVEHAIFETIQYVVVTWALGLLVGGILIKLESNQSQIPEPKPE
jgi:hypothetical protein